MKKYTKSQSELQKFKICDVVTASNRDPVETPDM